MDERVKAHLLKLSEEMAAAIKRGDRSEATQLVSDLKWQLEALRDVAVLTERVMSRIAA